MPRQIALALMAIVLVATPALAVETQPPTSPAIDQAGSASSNQHRASKTGGQTTAKPRPPAKIPSTSAAKSNTAAAVKKPSAKATATAKKHAEATKSRKAGSKLVKAKPAKSKPGSAEDHRNSNHAKTIKSKQAKSSAVPSRPAENRTPADTTGSVPPRSVPTPGLY
jgi:hypothetical protein